MHADPQSLNPSATPPALHAAACSIFDLECCPLCGGKAGFTYRATIRGTQFMPWKGSEIDAYFEDSDSKHGAYRCDDCGKIVKSNQEISR